MLRNIGSIYEVEKMTKGYDKLAVNHGMVLDLPFREGAGSLTHDVSKAHHILTQHVPGGGSFTWGNLVTGYPYLQFTEVGSGIADGVYLDCPALDTVDLNFTSGDYSLGGWINWTDTGHSVHIFGRNGVNLDGYELYLYAGAQDYLQLRHHHATFCPGTCPPDNERTGRYSGGWTPGTWHFFGVSRSGIDAQMYRNGAAVLTSGDDLHDPDTCNRNLNIGCQYTTDSDWYSGMMGEIYAWNRSLSALEWLQIFDRESHWYGL